MKVLLTSSVVGLGTKGEIKEVSIGYARNFLFPKNLARDVSSSNEQSALIKKDIIEKKKTSALSEKISSLKIDFKAKVHDDGNLYGSIGIAEIIEKLSLEGISISKNQILLEKPYKKSGNYEVKIKLSSTLIPTLRIRISAEKQV